MESSVKNIENPRVIISQKTTVVGSHSHFVRPRKYNDNGIMNNTVTKVTNTRVIRIQTERSENTKIGSPWSLDSAMSNLYCKYNAM